jgi:imidazolonepropionase
MAASPPWDCLWIGGHLATMAPARGGFGEIRNGALACVGDRITWVGRESDLPDSPAKCAREVRELKGGWLTPGLVDCHTHLVFSGDRSGEFEARLQGASYEEIARAGGGIRTTMRATRGATEEELYCLGAERLEGLLAEGVTTVEIKSGYGLDVDTELRMLRVARKLGASLPVDVQTSFLGAHVLPPEYEGHREEYLRVVREEMVPRVAEEDLADAVDAFCDEIAFTPRECEGVLRKGKEVGLAVRLHADQLTDQGGAALAARLGARSADHLERASREGVEAMAMAGTVAVLLPGAYFFLKDDHPPPVESFRAAMVPLALATDLNPGSSPVNSLLATLNLGCVLFGLTPEEAFNGVTLVGARALGLDGIKGSLEEGKMADLAIWEIGHPRELSYWLGRNPCKGVVKGGEATPLNSAAGSANRNS